MSRVADDLRRELRERMASLSAEERIRLTAALAECDLDLFCAVRGVPRDEGCRVLTRARRSGRVPSRAVGEVEQ